MKLSVLLCALSLAVPMHSAVAQPNPADTVTPLPPNKRPNKAKAQGPRGDRMRENAAKRDQKAIEEFETLFNRKLTDDEKKQLQKAANDRNAAVLAAQEAYQAQFLKITGVTAQELREKRRAAKANPAAVPAAAPAAVAPVAG